jgi:hypothetical protein
MNRLTILSNLHADTGFAVDPGELCRKINKTHRNSVLKWLFESLDLLRVEDSVFFCAVLLADRYCYQSSVRRKFEGADLQLVILASLCSSLKIVESSIDLSVRAFLEHVSGGHVEAKDIFQAEARVLQSLNFNAFSPPLSIYLDSFYDMLLEESPPQGPLEQEIRRTSMPEWAKQQKQFALLLLYLSVLDIDWLHSHPPSELISRCILTSSDMRNNGLDGSKRLEEIALRLVEVNWLDPSSDILCIISETGEFYRRLVSKPSEAVESILKIFGSRERAQASKASNHAARLVVSGG